MRLLAVLVLAALAIATLAAGGPLLLFLLLLAAAAAVTLLPQLGRRPERSALLIALVVVAAGGVAATVRVMDGLAHSRVTYSGVLDAREIRSTFAPTGPSGRGDPLPAIKRAGMGYLTSARGTMTKPRADTATSVLWALDQLAPWALAGLVLALIAPILRAAERGDPFWDGAARRLVVVGALLLVAIPGLAVLGYAVADAASAGTFAAPVASPDLSLPFAQLLPGLLVLALAGMFRRGAELRDLERHTI